MQLYMKLAAFARMWTKVGSTRHSKTGDRRANQHSSVWPGAAKIAIGEGAPGVFLRPFNFHLT